MIPLIAASRPSRLFAPLLLFVSSFLPGCRTSPDNGPGDAGATRQAAGFSASVEVPEGDPASIGTYVGSVAYPDGRHFEISGRRDGTLTAFWLQDLGGNENPELIVWMVGAGSGSYASIHVYWMNDDGPMLDDVSELPHGARLAYMGHDSVFVDHGKLQRCFPLYESGDTNASPSAGKRCLTYDTLMGWIISD